MKEFFNPTKAKVLLAFVLLLPASFFILYLISFFGSDLINMCLPRIPGIALPTPEPISLSKTFTDVALIEGRNTLCLQDDLSAQLASSITTVLNVMGVITFVIILNYFVSCLIISFVSKMKQQKKTSYCKIKEMKYLGNAL